MRRKILKGFIIGLSICVLFLGEEALFRLSTGTVRLESKIINEKIQGNVPTITKTESVKQVIPVNTELYGVGIRFATYGRNNTGHIDVLIQDTKTSEVFYKETLDVSTIENDVMTVLKFKKPGDPTLTKYLSIQITSPDCTNDNGITIECSTSDTVPDGALYLNDKESAGWDINYSEYVKVHLPFFTSSRLLCLFFFMLLGFMISFWPRQGFRTKEIKMIFGSSTKSSNKAAYVIPGVCIAVFAFIWGAVIHKNLISSSSTFLVNLVWFAVLLLVLIVFLVKRDYRIVFIFLCCLCLFCIFGDMNYAIYDEAAHFDYINHITNYHEFPLMADNADIKKLAEVFPNAELHQSINYEAVQGPLYYLFMAILTGLLSYKVRLYTIRIIGMIFLLVFTFFTRKSIDLLRENHILICNDGVIDAAILMFLFNPMTIIRMSRVTNESLYVALTGIIVYFLVKQLTKGFDINEVNICAVLCGAAFLTKATSFYLFGGVLLICLYYKNWKKIPAVIGCFFVSVLPWFVYNLHEYGSLTAMQRHIDFILPITNPEHMPVDLWNGFLTMFDSFFACFECPVYFFGKENALFSRIIILVLLAFLTIVLINNIYSLAKKRFIITYSATEKLQVLQIILISLLAASILALVANAAITFIPAIACRYLINLNGCVCILCLLCVSRGNAKVQNLFELGVCIFVGFIVALGVVGYTGKIMDEQNLTGSLYVASNTMEYHKLKEPSRVFTFEL